MTENPHGRSTETKYGRVPLWLYETGIGLQAIATYGWLHGRYGHYERIMPSYTTLAKELGVSRGSVIAYVKALVSVGAVKVSGSRQAGHTVNEYAIAFNAPFAVVQGGQNIDHLVSGLYPAGQNTDQGGQPAVPEEDVSTKTFEEDKDLSLPSVPKPQAVPAAACEEREISAPPDKTTTTTTGPTAAAVRLPQPRGEQRQQQEQDGPQAPSQPPTAPTAATDTADRILDAYTATLGRPVLTGTRSAIHAQAVEALAAGFPETWLTDRARELAANGWTGLAKHVAKSTVPLPSAAAADLPWCGECSSDDYRWIGDDEGRWSRCTRCNPAVVAAPATTPKPGGYRPFQCPPASAYSLGFDGQPLPGTDSTVVGWLALADSLDE